MSRIIRLWVTGDRPGTCVFDIDPPLRSDEVEIDTSDLTWPDLPTVSRADDALLRELAEETTTVGRCKRR